MANEGKKRVNPGQAFLMFIVGIAIIIIGLLVLKVNNRIVLAFDGAVMCFLAWIFGIKYDDLQLGIKNTITSMIVAILILLSVGTLVGSWMISGTVPLMIYYGMKILSPALFLPITCILCTVMSVCAGTSWGTLATVGIACMGVAQGLGVNPAAAAGAICVGAFFGDKLSPLSDSPVITSTVTDTPMMEGIKHAARSTVPAYIISLIFFAIYGLQSSSGTIGGDSYSEIINTLEASFNLNPILILPVIVVIVLIVMKKPTIPTFFCGIVVAAILGMIFQGADLPKTFSTLYSGYTANSGSALVDSMLNRGGLKSMNDTIVLLMAAAIFGAPLRTAGVIDIMLEYIMKVAKNAKAMSIGVLFLHGIFFMITGAYYVTYPIIGDMTKDLFPKYGLQKKNLMRIMLDTGTGFAPLVPWSTTGAYTAETLGVANMSFLPFAPMLWLSILFSMFYALTGICQEKIKK